MTQSTLRFLLAGIFTVGLLASLARGDDKQRAPELLPMPHCDACDKAADCCTVGAPCCQEGSDCCAKPAVKKVGFIVGEMPKGVDLSTSWSSSEVKGADVKQLIADLMNEYHALYKEHKYQEAEICAIKAQDLDPDNYVVGAAVQTAHMAKAHREYQDISHEKEDYLRKEIHEVESVGPLERTVRSAKIEQETRKKLESPVTGFDFRDTPLAEILDDLAGWSQIYIVPDYPTLKDRKVELSKPITLKLDGGSLRTVLGLVLDPAGLTYQVKNDALVITTKEKEPSKLERRVYPVSDLLTTNKPCELSCEYLQIVPEASKQNSSGGIEDVLSSLIQVMVEPQSWRAVGGPGAIVCFHQGKALVVSQTPEVHEQVQQLLNALRHVQAGPTATEPRDCCQNPVQEGPKATQLRDCCQNPAPNSQTKSCELVVGTRSDAACQAPQLVTEFAAPQLSNHEPAAQALPFITRDANGATRMGFTYGSFATEASPLPPPVPTFRLPQTVEGEKWTRDAATSVQVMQHAVRTELGTCTAGHACQEPTMIEPMFRVGVCGAELLRPNGQQPTSCGSPATPNVNPAFGPTPPQTCDAPRHWTTVETLQAVAPVCPSPMPANASFGQSCVPVQAEATKDFAISASTGLHLFVPQLGSIPVSLDFSIPRVNGTNSDQPQPSASLKDYRVSVGGGMRMIVPGLGPVPITFDLGVPVVKGIQSTQACPVAAVQSAIYPNPVQAYVPSAQNAVQPSPVFLQGVKRENYTTQAVATCEVAAVPASYAALTPTAPDNRHNERWTIRVQTEGDRPSFSVQSENASMECERLVLKLKQNGSLEFIAGKKTVRVRGKDFEAEAESIECQNNDGKLVLSGNVTLTSGKNDCMVKAKKVVWDSGRMARLRAAAVCR